MFNSHIYVNDSLMSTKIYIYYVFEKAAGIYIYANICINKNNNNVPHVYIYT